MTGEVATKPICAVCGRDHDPEALLSLAGYPLCRPCLEETSRSIGPPRRKAYKVIEGKQVAGVCGGLADYANMDRDTLRVLVVIAAACTAFLPILIPYLVLAFVMPTEP